MKIIFFGSDEFSVIVLRELLANSEYEVLAIVTTSAETPISLFAKANSLPLLQPAKLAASELKSYNADLGILVVYGKIISQDILDLFPKGILNIHPSLLPKYRGPSPTATVLLNGDSTTGLTIIRLDSEMDHGPILKQVKTDIKNGEVLEELRDRLAHLGAKTLLEVIPKYMDGSLELREQNHEKATFTKQFTKEDGKIDWKKSAQEIYDQYRAFHKWPGIWFLHKGKRVKILDCELIEDKLKITELQPEGKTPMTFKEFINGYGRLPETVL